LHPEDLNEVDSGIVSLVNFILGSEKEAFEEQVDETW